MPKDVAVIGAGPGGYVAAIRAAQLGAQVTLIEREEVGGTCLNWGCIPLKVMKTTAEMLQNLRRAGDFGIALKGDVFPDLAALTARKEKVIQTQAEGVLKLLKRHRVRYLKGCATIGENHMVTVKGPTGETLQVAWERLILAVGSQPLNLPAVSFDGKRILSSNDALSLHQIPKSILIVGGGVIGCEFAFIFASLGSKVTLVEALDRVLPLPSVDTECSKTLQREMKKVGILTWLDRVLDEVEEKDEKLHVTIRPSRPLPDRMDTPPLALEVDQILVCIGRQANTDGLGLEKLGVEMDEKGWIVSNEKMQTSHAGVYAIGDALGPNKFMLAHVASAEGEVAAENAMGGNRTMNYDVIPGAIFTMPEVACVGLTEELARARGYKVRSDSVLFRNIAKAQVIAEIAGSAKIVSDTDTGRILGVHLVGPHATDLIGEGALAVQTGCTTKELAETVHAHPTLTEVMAEAAFKALERPLHG